MKNTLTNIDINMKFIHYWKYNYFNSDLFHDIKNRCHPKPLWWLWWSPINSEYWWIDFCKDTWYWNHSENEIKQFLFSIKETSKILIIDNEIDVFNCIKTYWYDLVLIPTLTMKLIDYEKISQDYDWLLLTINWLYVSRDIDKIKKSMLFSSYDCESIIIFNKSIILSL